MTEHARLIFEANVVVMNLLCKEYVWADKVKTCMLLREPNCIKVDFYPHTGKWKFTKDHIQKVFSGGAGAFIKWYRENKEIRK